MAVVGGAIPHFGHHKTEFGNRKTEFGNRKTACGFASLFMRDSRASKNLNQYRAAICPALLGYKFIRLFHKNI
jgi:hypothetical protein